MSVDAEKANYGLGYSVAETQRLMVQNEALLRAVGYTVHPSLLPHIPDSPKIAEIATGPGTFLVSLSRELGADAQLDGYDISDSAFISKDALPKNIKLHVLNAKEEPPPELRQQYDAVFIRFMNIAMKPEEWALVARTALLLLRPGGGLQWFEGDFRQMGRILLGDPKGSAVALEAMTALYHTCAPYDGWCVDNLTRVLGTVGFNQVNRYISSSDRLPDMRAWMTELGIGASSGVVRQAITKGSFPGLPKAEEFEAMVDQAKDEAKQGTYMRVDMTVWTAFKST